MRKFWLLLVVMVLANLHVRGEEFPPLTLAPEILDAKGGHIQGIAASDEALYIAQMTQLVKIDWQGKLLKSQKVLKHTGDITFANGELFAAVAPYQGEHKGKGIIQVFDQDLNLLRETLVDRSIDGICFHEGVLYVGMGAKEQPSKNPHRVNLIGRFDAKTLKEVAPRAEFDYGFATRYGFQDIVQGRTPDDSIALCANSIDLHGSKGASGTLYLTIDKGA